MHRLLLVALVGICSMPAIPAQPARAIDPLAIVREYCRADGAGDRLSPTTWRRVAPLVGWSLEPAWDRLVLIKAYEISTPRRVGDRIEVEVRYKLAAEIVAGKVTRSNAESSITLTLIPTPDQSWLIAGPPHPPHVFESAADADALAELLDPGAGYMSNTALVWEILRDEGWDIPYTVSKAIPASKRFQEVGTASPGDLVVYYTNDEPYHVGWIEADDAVVSATLNAGEQTLPFAAFAGSPRYWRPIRVEGPATGDQGAVGESAPEAKGTPAPMPRRRP